MRVYYNEFDKKKCAMLKQLMDDGHISQGVIDDRPIQDVTAHEVQEYDRCHFFAGIGLWDYALNQAGWDDTQVWTGSCPCQPFSSAGRRKGKEDGRHLWPIWQSLISECKPAIIYGEQVNSAIAYGWLDDVYQGLESQGYAVGSAVLPACGIGSPQNRQRLWFVGHSEHFRSSSTEKFFSTSETIYDNTQGTDSALESTRTNLPWQLSSKNTEEYPDGKKRFFKPGVCKLVDGYPHRHDLINAIGNGIVPQLATIFIEATK